MARHARNTHVVNQAEVEGAIAGYFGVPAMTPGISDLARVVFPGVQAASRENPAAWRSVVLGVLANHIGMARGLGLEGSELQRQLQIMRASNRTSADFAQALARVQTLVAGMGGWRGVAAAIERGGSGDQLSSLARVFEMNGGPYSADRLPTEMGRWIGNNGDAHHVASVGNYLHSLGMTTQQVHQYAGFFVGSSETVRHAIREVRNGRQMTDADITNAHDARAIIGAIQAGRVRLEDAPPSVRRLMERMEREGVDPSRADPSQIQQFFHNNPNALEEARRANAVDIGARTGMTDEQLAAAGEARRREAVVVAPARPTTVVPAPRQTDTTLGLGPT